MIASFRPIFTASTARCISVFSLKRGMASLTVHAGLASAKEAAADSKQTVIIGQQRWLKQVAFAGELAAKLPEVSEALFSKAVKQLGEAGGKGQVPLHLNHAKIISIADKVSRHNSPANAHAIFKELKGLSQPNGVKTLSVVLYCHYEHALASVASVAKAFSLFSMKTAGGGGLTTGEQKAPPPTKLEQIHVEVVIAEGGGKQLTAADVTYLQALCDAIRDYARLVDTPANILHTEALLYEAEQMVNALGVPIEKTVIKGEELKKQGFGGIYSVGKAATHPPIFACFSHRPKGATENIALVGKGIVYDTGGFSIKGRTAMPTMKLDMGGAGAVLASFCALVKGGFKQNLHLLMCMAENSVSPTASKPDDIITMLSGKTVEINNTDAEGRLVLGDGVYYARTKLNATTIIDMATLTGAQGYISGCIHAAVISNSERCEKEALKAGLFSGDMLHPMVYAPDLHFSDLNSPVADMRNANMGHMEGPPSSLAALFIHAQNDFTDELDWIHVDFARPVLDKDERATGYGPALINSLLAKHMDEAIGVAKAITE